MIMAIIMVVVVVHWLPMLPLMSKYSCTLSPKSSHTAPTIYKICPIPKNKWSSNCTNISASFYKPNNIFNCFLRSRKISSMGLYCQRSSLTVSSIGCFGTIRISLSMLCIICSGIAKIKIRRGARRNWMLRQCRKAHNNSNSSNSNNSNNSNNNKKSSYHRQYTP